MSSTSEERQIIWSNTLDKRYDCKVYRTGSHTGTLVMTDLTTGEELVNKSVNLTYGAVYGPDAEDVTYWATECMAAADANLA